MIPVLLESSRFLRKPSSIGVAVGSGVLLLFLVAGLVFESWSVSDFLSNLTLESSSWFLLSSGMAIATFAVPIALYLRSRIVTPFIILGGIVLGWFAIGITSGVIAAGAIFGLCVYAISLSPVYFVLYLLLGGGEYYTRKRIPAYQ